MSGRVIVVGSANLDIVATTPRLPMAGETVRGHDLALLPGGKGANQAVAAARLGAPAELVTCLGADDWGDRLAAFLAAEGVGLAHLRRVDDATGAAVVLVDDHATNAIVAVPGANLALVPADVTAVDLTPTDVVVTQCEIPTEVTAAALGAARAAGARSLLNPSPMTPDAAPLVRLGDVVVVNEIEVAQLAGLDTGATRPRLSAAAEHLRSPQQTVVLTLGAAGALVVDDTGTTSIDAPAVTAVDTTGAGDCFLGALAAELASGTDTRRAVRVAVAAASCSVQRAGAASAMPRRPEVEAMVRTSTDAPPEP